MSPLTIGWFFFVIAIGYMVFIMPLASLTLVVTAFGLPIAFRKIENAAIKCLIVVLYLAGLFLVFYLVKNAQLASDVEWVPMLFWFAGPGAVILGLYLGE